MDTTSVDQDEMSLDQPKKQKHIHADHERLRKLPFNRLIIVFILTLIFMFVEVIVGYWANSLALIADAGHMLNDLLSIGLAIAAIKIATMEQSKQFTFGYKRVEVISGLLNGLSLLGIAIYVGYEGINRFIGEGQIIIQGQWMFITAILGLLVNLIAVYLLKNNSSNNINIEGAYQHIIVDVLGSIAAITASIGIILWNAYWLDPVVSVFMAIIIFKSGLSITYRALHIVLEAAPQGTDINQLLTEISEIDKVIEVHDLHAWTLTSNEDVISGHITIEEDSNTDNILREATKISREFGFDHPTFQLEFQKCDQFGNCFPAKSSEVLKAQDQSD